MDEPVRLEDLRVIAMTQLGRDKPRIICIEFPGEQLSWFEEVKRPSFAPPQDRK